jgi:hypothetical protein
VIWEPFLLALVLGLVVSAGLYFAYLWPSVEPLDEEAAVAPAEPVLAGGAAEPDAGEQATEPAATEPATATATAAADPVPEQAAAT